MKRRLSTRQRPLVVRGDGKTDQNLLENRPTPDMVRAVRKEVRLKSFRRSVDRPCDPRCSSLFACEEALYFSAEGQPKSDSLMNFDRDCVIFLIGFAVMID